MSNQGRQCPKHSTKRQSGASPNRQISFGNAYPNNRTFNEPRQPQVSGNVQRNVMGRGNFNDANNYNYPNMTGQYTAGEYNQQSMHTQGYQENNQACEQYVVPPQTASSKSQRGSGAPPLNVVVKVTHEGQRPTTKGELVWSSGSPNRPTCKQVKNLDNWTGEESFTVGGNCDAQHESQQDAMLRLQEEMEAENQIELISNQQRGVGQNMCNNKQPTQRFRAGGGPCCGAGGGGSGAGSDRRGSAKQSSKTERTPSASRNSKGGSNSQVCGCSQAGGSQVGGQENDDDCYGPTREKTTSNISSGSHRSSEEPKLDVNKFTFSTPDSLRTKLNEYIQNRPADGKKFSGRLKPFRGFREDVISCKTCFDVSEAESPPAACMPCGRLELTAEDFAREEMEAENRAKAKAEAEAREQAMAELDRYKQVMPADFTNSEQLEYLKCMGASKKAICLLKELHRAEENSGSCGEEKPSPPPCKVPSQSKTSSQCGASAAANPCPEENDIGELIRQCREQLSETKRKHGGASQEKTLSPSADCYTKNTVDDDVKLFQMLAQQNAKRLSQIQSSQDQLEGGCYEEQPPECLEPSKPSCCIVEDEIVEDDLDDDALQEENMKYLQLPMFGPHKQKAEENLAEAMEMYRIHLANIRKRYFGEVIKLIDEVENITPEIAAAMVYSEEDGFKMTDAPLKLYEYLYPESPSQPLVHIANVTGNLPEGYEDIVVPLVPPMFLHAADYPGLEDPAMLDPPRIIQIGPSPNLAEDPAVTETKKAEDVTQLVTGVADQSDEEFHDADEEDEEDEDAEKAENVFNVKLQTTMPPHYSRMQMRGSQAPNWFPGYFYAYQSKPGVIVQGCHGTVLEQVWQDVQPDAVRPAGGACIIGE